MRHAVTRTTTSAAAPSVTAMAMCHVVPQDAARRRALPRVAVGTARPHGVCGLRARRSGGRCGSRGRDVRERSRRRSHADRQARGVTPRRRAAHDSELALDDDRDEHDHEDDVVDTVRIGARAARRANAASRIGTAPFRPPQITNTHLPASKRRWGEQLSDCERARNERRERREADAFGPVRYRSRCRARS